VNVFIFLLTYTWPLLTGAPDILKLWARPFMLVPLRPYVWQFVSYAFLHGSVPHIVGNMFFLYLFGNNVNDKLGNVGYLCLYLGSAVYAGIGHAILHTNPVLGASGAVAAVTGAYLVLFPQTLITVFYWFFFGGTMQLSALYFIVFKLIFWDNVIEPRFSVAAVAYDAHLAGYAYGIAALLLLLGTGIVSGSGFDLWSMIKQWTRRRRYRDVVSGGYDPFTGRTAAKPVVAKEVKTEAQRLQEQRTEQLRGEIGSRIAQRNLPAAAQLYLELMEIDSSQIPPRQYLLDIANQLASENRHAESARAYEAFLAHYASYEYVEQVQLMLGILYSRYLGEPELAVKHLQAAAKKLSDPGQLKMCRDELAELGRPVAPDIIGMTEADAKTAITGVDSLAVGTTSYAYNDTVASGLVSSQSPTGGSSMAVGSSVDLVVSLGRPRVPDVVGISEADANTAITGVDNLLVGTTTYDYNNTVASGLVSSQNPAAGTTVPVGSSIDLVVSLGQPEVPDVVGMIEADANSAITGVDNLAVGTIAYECNDTIALGIVLSQSPSAGTVVSIGSTIDLVVSLGQPIVPDVVGMTEADANTAISAVDNLAVGTTSYEHDDTVPSGLVLSQSPTAGNSVTVGSRIDLVISLGR
jgi:beta-lactam-binding protein with PASTA domain/membrane associated rhomboid family serine protease